MEPPHSTPKAFAAAKTLPIGEGSTKACTGWLAKAPRVGSIGRSSATATQTSNGAIGCTTRSRPTAFLSGSSASRRATASCGAASFRFFATGRNSLARRIWATTSTPRSPPAAAGDFLARNAANEDDPFAVRRENRLRIAPGGRELLLRAAAGDVDVSGADGDSRLLRRGSTAQQRNRQKRDRATDAVSVRD